MSLYIFLNADGVMVTAKGRKAPELMTDGFPNFSAKAVAALHTLLAPDAIIILTTSYK